MKKALIILLMGVMLVCTSCAGGSDNETAKAQVQAMLDAGYKASFDKYIELTGESEEDAKAKFEENFNNSANLILGDTEIEESKKDELKEKIRKIISLADYEITGATKTADNEFDVEVTVTPVTVFKDLNDKLMNKMMEKVSNMSESDVAALSEEDASAMAVDIMMEVFDNMLVDVTYADPVETTVHIIKNDDGSWEISPEDMMKLDGLTFEY